MVGEAMSYILSYISHISIAYSSEFVSQNYESICEI